MKNFLFKENFRRAQNYEKFIIQKKLQSFFLERKYFLLFCELFLKISHKLMESCVYEPIEENNDQYR